LQGLVVAVQGLDAFCPFHCGQLDRFRVIVLALGPQLLKLLADGPRIGEGNSASILAGRHLARLRQLCLDLGDDSVLREVGLRAAARLQAAPDVGLADVLLEGSRDSNARIIGISNALKVLVRVASYRIHSRACFRGVADSCTPPNSPQFGEVWVHGVGARFCPQTRATASD
jgi:hypothetical protein